MRSPLRTTIFAAAATLAVIGPAAIAQPPEPPPGPRDGPPPHGPHDPLRRALDANHDFEIDADEIAQAPAALVTLDADGDGRLDRGELRPPPGPRPDGPGRGPADRGFEGRPRRPGDQGGRPPRADRVGPPPGDGDQSDGPPPPPARDDRDERQPREGVRSGERGPGERPSPDRFMERALSFDADGDGSLDRAELTEFAEAVAERMRSGRGPGGPSRDGGPRPNRPRRPE